MGNGSKQKQVMIWKTATMMMTKIPCLRFFRNILRWPFAGLDDLFLIVIWPSTHHSLKLCNNHELLSRESPVGVLLHFHSLNQLVEPLLPVELLLTTTIPNPICQCRCVTVSTQCCSVCPERI